MVSLFKDDGIVKEAVSKKLSDNEELWPQEIKSLLLEKTPFVGKYSLAVNFQKLDEESGYGMGVVEVSSGPGSSVKLPFIIKDNELLPIDLIAHNGAIKPLTESRLTEALFRPQLFDDVVKDEDIKPTTMVSSVGNATPPGHYNMGGPVSVKTSSLSVDSLMDAIKGTIAETDLQKTAELLSTNEGLADAVFDNPATVHVVHKLKEEETVEKVSSLQAYVRPTVLQITEEGGKYFTKEANPKAFSPIVEKMDRPQALAKYGFETVRAVDNVGTLTVTTDALVDRDEAETKYASVNTSGVYKAICMDGSPIKGIVLDKLADLNGDITDTKLFITSNEMSLQDDLVGEKLASVKYASMPSDTPEGLGVFYWDGDNGVEATVPLVVHETVKIAGDPKYDVSTLLEEEAKLIPSKVNGIVKVGREVLIPQDSRFMKLPGMEVIPLANKDEIPYRNTSDGTSRVNIKCASGRFYFKGACNVEKLAGANDGYDWNDAMFISACLGMHPEFAEAKLAQATKYAGGTTVMGLREIVPMESYVNKAQEKLAQYKTPLSAFMRRIRQDLWKQASMIEDEDTVDKMLSLNFINPENIKVFIEYLPSIEKCQRKLCELLMASRLGLKPIDENSLSSAIAGVEKAIEGLKVLMHTQY